MRNTFIILLLLFLLLWSGLEGMRFLSSYSNSAQTTIKKPAIPTLPKRSTAPKNQNPKRIAAPENINTPVKQGEIALNAIRGQERMDVEGKLRNDKDFYKDTPTKQEKQPYNRPAITTPKQIDKQPANTTVDNNVMEEMRAKGAAAIKAEQKSTFNIEKGTTKDLRPKSYNSVQKAVTTKKKTNNVTSSQQQGKHIVVGGTFSSKQNAITELKRFKGQGFKNATIVSTGKFHVIALNRYHVKTKAKQRALAIKKKGIDVFVKTVN